MHLPDKLPLVKDLGFALAPGLTFLVDVHTTEVCHNLQTKGSGLLMTRLYKEKPKSWDTCNLVLTFQVLNCSKIAFLQSIYMI